MTIGAHVLGRVRDTRLRFAISRCVYYCVAWNDRLVCFLPCRSCKSASHTMVRSNTWYLVVCIVIVFPGCGCCPLRRCIPPHLPRFLTTTARALSINEYNSKHRAMIRDQYPSALLLSISYPSWSCARTCHARIVRSPCSQEIIQTCAESLQVYARYPKASCLTAAWCDRRCAAVIVNFETPRFTPDL